MALCRQKRSPFRIGERLVAARWQRDDPAFRPGAEYVRTGSYIAGIKRGRCKGGVGDRAKNRPGRVQEMGATMYEPSRNLFTFHIAGFQHHDGALVLSKIKVGDALALVPEPDNPYVPDAVAVKYGDVMLGYIPADSVGPLSVMFHYGHGDAFECVVIQVAPENDPWKQVRASIRVTDAR